MLTLGDKILCKIHLINKKYLWVELPFGYSGLVFLDSKNLGTNRRMNYYRVGQQIILKIEAIFHLEKKAYLSDIRLMNYYSESEYPLETPSGFRNLKKHAENQINYDSRFKNKV